MAAESSRSVLSAVCKCRRAGSFGWPAGNFLHRWPADTVDTAAFAVPEMWKMPWKTTSSMEQSKKVGQIKTETAFAAGDFETAEITERLPGQTGIFQPTVQTTAENQESARPAV